MFILNFHVNWLSVILMVVASFAMGWLWYSPYLFGNRWRSLVGMTSEMSPEMKKSAGKAYLMMLVPSFVKAYMLAFFIKNMFVSGLNQNLLVAILLWLGFIATATSSEYIFNTNKKPWELYLINESYELVVMIIGAAIMTFLR